MGHQGFANRSPTITLLSSLHVWLFRIVQGLFSNLVTLQTAIINAKKTQPNLDKEVVSLEKGIGIS
jgi:hypothetical protein